MYNSIYGWTCNARVAYFLVNILEFPGYVIDNQSVVFKLCFVLFWDSLKIVCSR